MSGHRLLSPNARVASAALQFPDVFPVTREEGSSTMFPGRTLILGKCLHPEL